MNLENLKTQLAIDEDYRLKPYVDTVGKITIGVGHNLTDNGLKSRIIGIILEDDIDSVIADLTVHLPWWTSLCEQRQEVLANMCFNLGIDKLMLFQHFLAATRAGRWVEAKSEMLNSKWATDVGDRAVRLASEMEIGDGN